MSFPKHTALGRALLRWSALAVLVGLTSIPGKPLAAPDGELDASCPADGEDVLNASLPHSSRPPAAPLRGAFEVTSQGSAAYRIPLTVAPGRAGMAPELALSYSSNNDEEGTLGVGFSIAGFSTIERCQKDLETDGTIAPVRFDNDDALCLDGNRLVWTGETGVANGMSYLGFRTRVDGGDRIVGYWTWAPNGPSFQQFEIFHRSGLISTYGATAESRVMAKDGIIASWLEDRRRDRRDNAILFHYLNDHDPADGHTLSAIPTEIVYTDHPSSPAQRKVTFKYGSLGDDTRPLVTYRDGLRKHTSKRLERVVVGGPGGTIVRSYSLSYDQSTSSHRDRLRQVKECVGDSDAAVDCRPPIKLDWSEPAPGGAVKKVSTPVLLPGTDPHDVEVGSFDYHMADVNGDGLDDVVTIQKDGALHYVHVALATGGLDAEPFAAPELWATIPVLPGFIGYKRAGMYKIEVADLDGDGNADLTLDEPFHLAGTYFWLRADPAAKHFVFSSTGIPRQPYPAGVPEDVQLLDPDAFQSIRYVDLDGDGVIDALRCQDDNWIGWQGSSLDYDGTKVTWQFHRGLPGTGTFAPPVVVDLYHTGCGADFREVDLNGDGRVELVRRAWESPPYIPSGDTLVNFEVGPYIASELSEGPVMLNHEIEGLEYHDQEYMSLSQIRFADVNGDGLPDAIHLFAHSMAAPLDGNDIMIMLVQHNTGRGFATARAVVSPTLESIVDTTGVVDATAWFNYAYERSRVIDVNGDARADLLAPWDESCPSGNCYGAIKLSARFDSVASVDYLRASTEKLAIPYIGNADGPMPASRFRPRVSDVDGDGRTDLLAPDPTSPAPDGFVRLVVHEMADRRDRVIAIHDGTNPRDPGDPGYTPTVAIDYGNLVDLERTWAGINTGNLGSTNDGTLNDPKERYRARADGANGCEYPRRCLVGSRQVVAGYTTEDGNGGSHHYAVQLRDGRYDVRGRRSLGFGALRVIDTDTLAGHASFYDNATYDTGLHVYPFAYQAKKSWKWTPPLPSQPLQRLTVEYVSRAFSQQSAPGRYFTVPWFNRTRVDEADFEVLFGGYAGLMAAVEAMEASPHDTIRDSTRVITDVDEFGNVRAEREETSGIDDVRTTTREYDNDTGNWLIGREIATRTCSESLGLAPCRTWARTFNGHGELTKVEVGTPAEVSARLVTEYVHDARGNVILTRQHDGYGKKRSTCAAYDQEGVFPVTAASSLGHVSRARYDRGLGVVTDRLDENGELTSYVIDGTGHVSASLNADGTWRTFDLSRSKQATPDGDLWRMVSTVTRSDGATESTTMDSHGRVIGTAKAAPNGPSCHAFGCVQDGTIVTDTTYDHRGLVVARTVPHLLGQPAGTVHVHHYTHDALGREIEHETPWGATIHTSYGPHKISRTTPLGTTTVELDGLGREITVVDALGGATSFTYGPFGDVWAVDALGFVTQSSYDAYGRRVSHTDPDRGTTIVDYDGYGQKLYETDALGRTIARTYDALGRVTHRLDPDGDTLWIFDTADHGKGRIAEVWSPSGVYESYAYDKHGRPAATTVKVGNDAFTTSLSYDDQGRVATITYPADEFGETEVVRNVYDGRGYLSSVEARLPALDGYHWKQVWHLDETDSGGRVRRFSLGNGVQTLQGYGQADGTLRLIETHAKSGQEIQKLEYDYDDSLSLTARKDKLQEVVERFTHDELGRLRCGYFGEVMPPNCPTEIEYEPNGNIYKRAGVGAYTYDPSHPHAVRTAGSLGFEYDAVGNQIGRPGAVITYTAFDLPSRYTMSNGDVVDFAYSGDHARVRKIAAKEERTTIGRYYERTLDLDSGSLRHRYRIFSPEREVAAVIRKDGDSGIEYEHTDHLGSLDVLTDDEGNVVKRLSFDAFGAQRDPAWGQQSSLATIDSLGYTGQEHDLELGIINMRGRLYDPVTGRFMNVDPKVPHPRSTQSWNPYSYVLNAPLNLVDPDGLEDTKPPSGRTVTALVPLNSAADEKDRAFLVSLSDGSDVTVTAGEVNEAAEALQLTDGPKQVADECRAPEPATKTIAEPVQRNAQAGTQPGGARAPSAQAGKAPAAPTTQSAREKHWYDGWEKVTFGVGLNLGFVAGGGGSVELGSYGTLGGERGYYGSAAGQGGLAAGAGPGVSGWVTFDRKDVDGESRTYNLWMFTFSFSTPTGSDLFFGELTGIGIGHNVTNSGVDNVFSIGASRAGTIPIFRSWGDFILNRDPEPPPPPPEPPPSE